MSKKIEAIKDMVFYAQQKPESLATLIAGLVTDVVTSIKVDGATSINVPTGDIAETATYTASALSQYGDEMSNSVTLALNEAVTGVAISGGVVSVSKTAVAEKFVLKATCGTVTQLVEVALIPANAE